MIQVKRVYEPHAAADGARYLIDRLWPRGIARSRLVMDAWLKDAAPSAELRRWFNHKPSRWPEFMRRYRAELQARPEAWTALLENARCGPITLLYSAHDVEHNNAIVLRDFLDSRLETQEDPGPRAVRTNG